MSQRRRSYRSYSLESRRSSPLWLWLAALGAIVAFGGLGSGCKKSRQASHEPAKRAKKRARRKKAFNKQDWGYRACVYKPCYKRFKVFGQVSGRIEIAVDKTGAATRAVYRRGKAPAPVRKCIIAAARKVKVPGFFGNPGTIFCEYSGQLMAGGIEMISDSWGFREHRKLVFPPANAKTPRPSWYPADFPLPKGGRLVRSRPPGKKSPFYSGLFLFARPVAALVAALTKGAKAKGWKLKSTKRQGRRGTVREWIHKKGKRRRLLTRTRKQGKGSVMLIVPPAVK